MTGYFTLDTGTAGITIRGTDSGITGVLSTTAGFDTVIRTGAGSTVKIASTDGLSPKLYFSFVKSKLKETEVRELKKRTKYFYMLLQGAKESGQAGLAEKMDQQIYVLLKDQEAAACGYKKFVLGTDIEKFRWKVKDKTVDFCKLDNYPRAIPAAVSKVIKEVKSKSIFDEFWVLYNNPTKEGVAKTTKDRVREKDPILFGRFKYDLERYFYITDWIDEYCDLTFDKFLEELKKEKVSESYSPGEIPEPTEIDLMNIRKRVLDREKTVEETNRSNWKEVERLQARIQELETAQTKPEAPKPHRRWWRWWGV